MAIAISKSKTINVSADQLWSILGDDFANVALSTISGTKFEDTNGDGRADIIIVNNHFSSRFGSTPVFGGPQPFTQAAEVAPQASSTTSGPG